MRILHIITSLHTGGAEKLVVEFATRFRQLGFDVDVALFNADKTIFMEQLTNNVPNIHIFKLGHSYYNPLFIWKLRQIIVNYDIIHTHNSSPQLYTAIANIGIAKPLITTEHNTTNSKRNYMLFRIIDRWCYNKYKRIICISEQTKNNLINDVLKKSNYSLNNICTIYNGIDVQKYEQAKPLIRNKDKTIIVMVAAFRQQKDQDTIIKAVGQLQKNKYELWLVGDGIRKNVLKNLAENLKLKDVVKFYGVRSDVPNILKTADIVVMSSHWEGFGLAAVEGMAAGKPVIASDVDGLKQIVDGYGILFPHEDVDALADSILKLSQDENYYQEIARKCSIRAKEYDIKKTVEGYMKLYQQVIGESV